MKNAIKNRKGEGYIDTAVAVVCAMMVIVARANNNNMYSRFIQSI